MSARPSVTVGIPTRNRAHLLQRAISSVLAQSLSDFILVVSDNASEDGTAEVVASFEDSRILYRPLELTVERPANFNRLVELADTEFLVALGDDDELHPEHLTRTLEVARSQPAIGAVHTAYEIVDMRGRPLGEAVRSHPGTNPVSVVAGDRFVERCMAEGPSVCLSSTLFRRAALVSAGGWRPEDGIIDDLPLLMRVAARWDFAYIDQPLALMRAHSEADSSALGSFTPNGFRSSRSLPDVLHGHRRKFIAEAGLSSSRAQRLARVAERSHRREVVGHLATRATTGDRPSVVLRQLVRELRRHPRLALEPVTWRFVAGQLGGRQLRAAVRRRRTAASPAR